MLEQDPRKKTGKPRSATIVKVFTFEVLIMAVFKYMARNEASQVELLTPRNQARKFDFSNYRILCECSLILHPAENTRRCGEGGTPFVGRLRDQFSSPGY